MKVPAPWFGRNGGTLSVVLIFLIHAIAFQRTSDSRFPIWMVGGGAKPGLAHGLTEVPGRVVKDTLT